MEMRHNGLMNTRHLAHVQFHQHVSQEYSVPVAGSYCMLAYDCLRSTETRTPWIKGVQTEENKQEMTGLSRWHTNDTWYIAQLAKRC